MSQTAKPTTAQWTVRKFLPVALLAIVIVLILGALAPFLNATRFSDPIQQALESSLGRHVQFSAVHFSLFSGPGFSLDNVVIGEDPRYGLEPFAYVPTLQARIRLDKLLFGGLRFASLRLIDPSLNLVKRSDGTWNVVELVERLTTPRRAPLSLFPAFEVTGARIDFKFGTRKNTLYVLDSDFTIYPERSGKLYIQFSGSPARTDRAGNGFGHFHGNANWYVNPPSSQANQLEADVTLDPSNLSELTTLFEGHDAGVHGTISSRARIEGPSTALRVSGELRLEDVHRWDLLASSGEDWRIRYRGDVDWLAHKLNVQTLPWHAYDSVPVALAVTADDFLRIPVWTVQTRLTKAPVGDLLPLAKRMGLPLPQNLSVNGSVDGTIDYSNHSGLAGRVVIRDATATLPDIPALHATAVNASVSGDRVHFEPAMLETSTGTLQVSGDYFLSAPRMSASLVAEGVPVGVLKSAVDAWFGAPPAFSLFKEGILSGKLSYAREEDEPASWAGKLDFSDTTLNTPGLAVPLAHSEGRLEFDDTSLDVSHFVAALGKDNLSGSYHYDSLSGKPARLRVQLVAANLSGLEAALNPALQDQSILGRLRFSRRMLPPWLAARNVEGDLDIASFSVDQTKLGSLNSHFIWLGTNLQISSLQLKLLDGQVGAHGTVNLSSYVPRYRFSGKLDGLHWRGGRLSASGHFDTAGMGPDSLQHLHAEGSFSGEDLNLSSEDVFNKVSGLFDFTFADGWPDLRLSKLQMRDGEDSWNGEANSESDGRLVVDLERAGQQRRVISSILPESTGAVSSLSPRIAQ